MQRFDTLTSKVTYKDDDGDYINFTDDEHYLVFLKQTEKLGKIIYINFLIEFKALQQHEGS